jgi:hypothetical protein
VGEMLGGVLLLVPQFTALGSLVTIAVMSNVLMLNLCYDVPRKIYSIHLIVFCLFLLFPDMRRVADFFLLNRRTQLTPTVVLFKEKYLNYGVWALQLGIGIIAIIVCCNQANIDANKNVTYIQPSVFRGIWSVEDYVIDGVPKPPLLTDTDRWQRAIFDAPKILTAQGMDGSFKRYYLELKPDGKSFNLWDIENTNWRTTLNFEMPDPDHMTLVGNIGGHPAALKLSRVDLSDPVKFLLLNRGMHWVTDFAHNR